MLIYSLLSYPAYRKLTISFNPLISIATLFVRIFLTSYGAQFQISNIFNHANFRHLNFKHIFEILVGQQNISIPTKHQLKIDIQSICKLMMIHILNGTDIVSLKLAQ